MIFLFKYYKDTVCISTVKLWFKLLWIFVSTSGILVNKDWMSNEAIYKPVLLLRISFENENESLTVIVNGKFFKYRYEKLC